MLCKSTWAALGLRLDIEIMTQGHYRSSLRPDAELLYKLLRRERPMEGLRIYVGYSGWAPGQLEAEIARGSWRLVRAEAAAIFDNKSERPWPDQDTSGVGRRT